METHTIQFIITTIIQAILGGGLWSVYKFQKEKLTIYENFTKIIDIDFIEKYAKMHKVFYDEKTKMKEADIEFILKGKDKKYNDLNIENINIKEELEKSYFIGNKILEYSRLQAKEIEYRENEKQLLLKFIDPRILGHLSEIQNKKP